MRNVKHSSSGSCFRGPAFTLIEIVVALTIVAVVAAVAIPTMKGLNHDEEIRGSIKTLGALVQEVRDRAMRERKAYQIVFEHEGIHASAAMHAFEKREEFLEHFEEMRNPPPKEVIERVQVQRQEIEGRPVAGSSSAAEEPREPEHQPPWTATIPLKNGTECEVLMWGDGEWDMMEGDKMRRWVFQPTGMLNPARVRLHMHGTILETAFDILTGEMLAETSRVAPGQQP